MSNAHLIDVVKWPCQLSEENKLKFLSLCEHKDTISGGELSISNERGLYYVLEGLATYNMTSLDMKPFVGGVLGYQNWFGAMMMYDYPTITLHSAEIEPLSMLFLPKKQLENLLHQDEKFFRFLYAIGQANGPRYLQATLLAHYSIEERLIYSLFELLAQKRRIAGTTPTLMITQQQLCDFSGVSRPRASEVLTQLKQAGLIEMSRGTMLLTNIDKLYEKIANVNLELHNPYLLLAQANN